MKRMMITEEQFKKLLGHETERVGFFPLRRNRFDISLEIFKEQINEGLYKTYPVDFVLKHFRKYIGFSTDWKEFVRNFPNCPGFITNVVGENGNEYIEFVAIDNQELLEKADKALNLCGYYKAFCEPYGDCKGYVQSGYEKRHDVPIKLKSNKLYHITRRESIPKIKREGLVPKSRNKQTYHPERIYFFTKDYGKNGFETIAKNLYGNSSTFGYVIFEIDTNKLNDVTFHYDVNTQDGVYTTDNIPPDAIKKKYEFKS